MADAIGSVRATFTASAGGMIGAIDQIVSKLGSFAAATKRTQAQTTEYNKIVGGLGTEFLKGGITADEYAEKIGRIQGKFKGIGEAERMAVAMDALRTAQQSGAMYAENFADAEAKVATSVRAATPPIERLSIDLAKNRADFLAGKISIDQYRQTIATLPAQINGTETAMQKMERVFKESQSTVRGLQTPTEELNAAMAKLKEQEEAGLISDQQYAQAKGAIEQKLRELTPEFAAAKAAEEAMNAAMERGRAVTESLLTPQQQYDRSVQELDELLAKNVITTETHAAAVRKEKAALEAADPAMQELNRAMEDGKAITEAMRSPTEKYEQEVKKLDDLLAKNAITEETHARAVKKSKDELDKAGPAAKSVGDAFGGLPGPLGAAARAFDMMQKSMGSTVSGFKAGGVKGGVSNFVGQIQSGIANAGSTGGASLVGIAPQIAVIAGAAYAGYEALKQLTGALSSVGSEVERTAQLAGRLGVSFQEYEILAVAANNAGVETEALASAQTKGLKAISAARGGAEEQAKAFEALGISQEQLQNTSPNQVLELAAAKLNAIQDPASRAALAMKIFGKAGNDVLPALAGLDAVRGNIERLGGSMSNIDVGRFKAVDDAFDNLGVAGRRLGRTLLTPFTELFSRVSSGFAAVTGGLSKAFAPIGNLFAEIGGAIGLIVQGLGESLGVALRVVGAFLQMSSFTAIAAGIGAAIDQLAGGFSSVGSYIEPLVVGLETIASFMSDNVTRAITAVVTIFGNFVSSIFESVGQSALLSGLFAAMSSGASLVVEAFKSVGGWVSYVVAQLEYWAGIEPKKITSPEDKEAVEAQIKAQEELAKQQEQEQKAAEQRAKTIRDGLLSPYEKMTQAIAEVNDLEKRGLLTAQERAAQEAKIRDEFAKQDPLAQAAAKAAEEQKKASDEISKKIKDSAKAGLELGAAADPIRAQFKSAAEQIKKDMEAGLISPETAKEKMGEAVDAMNEELKRLGEDQKFAEKIRDSLKSEMDKVNEELDNIDKNQTLTQDEKDRAKAQVREKAAASLPGSTEKSPADKFREDQKKLREAFDKGIIDKDQFKERMGNIREQLEESISDARDKQERNKGPDRRAVGATDVNSSEGASTFFRLLRGQDDPTKKQLKEMEKQTRLLASVEEALASQEVVNI